MLDGGAPARGAAARGTGRDVAGEPRDDPLLAQIAAAQQEAGEQQQRRGREQHLGAADEAWASASAESRRRSGRR